MSILSRRDFARNAALAALFSPFINVLQPKTAQAAPGKAKFFLLFFTNGRDTAAWRNSGSDSSLTLSAQTEPLSPIKSNLVIVEKCNSNGMAASHGAPGGLCGGDWSSPLFSIEQFVSDGLKAAGVTRPVANIVLGGAEGNQPTNFYRDSKPLTPIYSPATAFQALFGNGVPTTTGGGGTTTPTTDPTAAARLKRKQSIISLVRGELTGLEKALGSVEKQKLEAHLDSLAQLEKRIQGSMTSTGGQQQGGSTGGTQVSCKAPAKPSAASQPFLNSSIHLDLAINAFACDITRVAAVQFGHHQMCPVDVEGAKGDYHNDFMHSDPAPHSRLANCEKWLAGQFLAAVNKLKSLPAPDGSGTLFDQTIIMWARDMGDAPNHSGDDMAYIFSGGAGGSLKTGGSGRFINANGASHQSALLTAASAMGLTNLSSFGSKTLSHEPLSGVLA
ncbi:MAG TPA: DUF1552 domain-containing protein [Polyangiaceae bacterium]|nr:DUF1552 domain-containing protein [Polyangiaceae bacterium]